MADRYLTKPCVLCGHKITGANYHFSNCNTCLCFLCGVNTNIGTGKATCPECGSELS